MKKTLEKKPWPFTIMSLENQISLILHHHAYASVSGSKKVSVLQSRIDQLYAQYSEFFTLRSGGYGAKSMWTRRIYPTTGRTQLRIEVSALLIGSILVSLTAAYRSLQVYILET